MSAIVTELVWSQSKSCRGSRLVMLALARESDDKGRSTLTLEQISVLTQLTARSITKCLGELTKLGELSRERGGGASNPNSYSILLSSDDTETPADSETELPSVHPEVPREGRRFQDVSSQNGHSMDASRKPLRQDWEISSSRTRGGSTPYGSTTTKEQASLPKSGGEHQARLQGPVTVPEGAKDLVTAITNAGMLVGWRLTESEWDRVTALAARWGNERLVEMISRRWNNDRPPQSARYLLRIWADLPSHDPTAIPKGNVVPLLRQHPRGWVPFQNTAEPSAYQNGF